MQAFWLVFWGIIFTAGGASIAALLHGTIWLGALIGLVVYLLLLALLYSGGDGGGFTYIDLDFSD